MNDVAWMDELKWARQIVNDNFQMRSGEAALRLATQKLHQIWIGMLHHNEQELLRYLNTFLGI
jgi:hypothetical protein